MQEKDSSHPIERCRGCYSLFGGSLEPCESPEQGLRRELTEELVIPDCVDTLMGDARYWRAFTLPGNQYPHEYVLHVLVSALRDETFAAVAAAVCVPGVVAEGHARVVDRPDLLAALPNTDRFVASLDVVVRAFITRDPSSPV